MEGPMVATIVLTAFMGFGTFFYFKFKQGK